MNFKNVIGIDVSKNTIDVCIHLEQLNKQFKNTKKGLTTFIRWTKEHLECIDVVLFVFEHTGMYSYLITTFFDDNNYSYFIAPALVS